MSPELLTPQKERVFPIGKSAAMQFERSRQWLRRLQTAFVAAFAATWVSAGLLFERTKQWLMVQQQAAFLAAGLVIVLLLLVFSGGTAAVAAVAAWIALLRHFAQTEADRQRRITESYSKAVEQLAHEKIEVRLGGIYTLERISRESPGDYWTVMETLCAFARERASWQAPEIAPAAPVDERAETTEGHPSPLSDIAAVLSVIVRRDEKNQQREEARWRRESGRWRLDLHETNLRGADLYEAILRRADLRGANLSGADLVSANLFGADLRRTRLRGAHLSGVDLRTARLRGANFNGAHLTGANLSRTDLREANFSGADLMGAILNAHSDEVGR